MKNCKFCKEDKAFDNFYNYKSSKDGKYYICKKCTEEQKYINKHYTRFKDKEEGLENYVISSKSELPLVTLNQEQLTANGRIEHHNGKQWLVLPSRV